MRHFTGRVQSWIIKNYPWFNDVMACTNLIWCVIAIFAKLEFYVHIIRHIVPHESLSASKPKSVAYYYGTDNIFSAHMVHTRYIMTCDKEKLLIPILEVTPLSQYRYSGIPLIKTPQKVSWLLRFSQNFVFMPF